MSLGLLAAACAYSGSKTSSEGKFPELTHGFLATHFAYRPLEAVALGWHQEDGRFVVPTQAAVVGETKRLEQFDRAFAAIDLGPLSPSQRHQLAVLRSSIAGQRWTFQTQRPATRNPMFYAGALDVSVYLKRDFKPLAERIHDIAAILQNAPELFAAARAHLEERLPRPFVETAIEVAEGTASFIEKDVAKAVTGLTNSTVQAEFARSSRVASGELRRFVEWLRTEKLPNSDGRFALGRDGYRAMLSAELIDLTPEQILELGLQELHAEQERFAAAAAVIDPKRAPVEVYKSIQREHPTATGLIPDTRKDLEAIRQFVVDHEIVTVPSAVRPRVEETLPPFRATSFASMDTPGPFETRATDAYYYVTPVEPDWSAEQAEQWLTSFNYYTTDIVSIHEAYPGHYVQFLALNASAASDVEKIFYSYPFVEGWAHYAEQMMMEEGFGRPPKGAAVSPEDLVKAAKYRLAQSDEALLRLCRLCCSIKLHTEAMTVEEATQFFIQNCHYEPKPARQEALRGTFDPGYLYYSLGKLMIYKLRRDWQRQEGPAFSLKRFHDEFLRHGAPPIRLLRELMLRDANSWPALL